MSAEADRPAAGGARGDVHPERFHVTPGDLEEIEDANAYATRMEREAARERLAARHQAREAAPPSAPAEATAGTDRVPPLDSSADPMR